MRNQFHSKASQSPDLKVLRTSRLSNIGVCLRVSREVRSPRDGKSSHGLKLSMGHTLIQNFGEIRLPPLLEELDE